ncbi:MAG: CPBP family intramembrane metalloprotease [Clostridiales bacterium]|nr:CPBP family intramembrane metalloprotease [Clostridiales bacterium]
MNSKKFFSRVGFAYFALIVLIIVVQVILSIVIEFFAPGSLYRYPGLYWIVSLAPQYLVAMPVCAIIMRRLPAMKLYQKKMKAGKWFSTLCIAIFIMEAGNIIGNLVCALIGALSGIELTSDIQDLMTTGSLGMVFLFSVILAPILEELVFRKLLIDRVIVFGDRTAILLSGLIFGMIHGNFYQFFYAFGLGCLFAYVYIRTGKVRYTISFHMAVNFLGGFIGTFFLEKLDYLQWINGDSIDAIFTAFFMNPGAMIGLVLYELLFIGLAIAGLVQFILSFRKTVLYSGEYEMSAGKMCKAIFGNAGMILFIISIVGVFAMNIFA